MMQAVGADPEALDAAANELRMAAEQLDVSAATLASSLGALKWLGQIAVKFIDLWSTGHQPRITTAAGFLRDNADRLNQQATQQRTASMSNGGSSGHLNGMGSLAAAMAAAVATGRLKEIADALAPELRRVRGLSDAEQLAWWNSLTDDQRRALLAIRPGELTALNGLPADVRLAAQNNYTSSISDQIVTQKASIHGEVEATIKIVKVGAGFDIEQRTYKDGSVKLELNAFIKAGVGFEDEKALAKAGFGGTFEFASQAEADAFIAGLARELLPSWKELWSTGFVLPAAATLSLLTYLKDNGSHLGAVESSYDIAASAGAGGAEVSAEAGVRVSVDTRGEGQGDVTISAHASSSASLKGGTLGVSGDVEVEASATISGTTPTNVTFKLSYENAALGGVFSKVLENSSGVTHSGTAEVSFDLTQPELRVAAEAATAALKRGDVLGATQALAGVMDRAQITVQQSIGSQINHKFDVKIVNGSESANVSTTTSTFVKPPGGSFYEVK